MATQWATTGAAQGTGDGSSEANRIELKKVIEDDAALASALAAGDLVNVKNDGTLSYDGSLDKFATVGVTGTRTARITIRGYTSTAGDGGRITINDTDGGATQTMVTHTAAGWYTWENINFTNGRNCFDLGTSDGHRFINITITGSTSGVGFNGGSGVGDSRHYINVIVTGKSYGWQDNARSLFFHNCAAIGNTNDGFSTLVGAYCNTFVDCIAHANGGIGFASHGNTAYVGCASNRNGSDGYHFSDPDSPSTLINCWATSNTGHALDATSANTNVFALNSGLQCTNENNTGGKANTNINLWEIGEITGDPDFTDSNPGTDLDVNLGLSLSSSGKGTAYARNTDETTTSAGDVGPAQRTEPVAGDSHLFIQQRRVR